MAIARKGAAAWNRWRGTNLRVQPDLTRIDLSGRDLRGFDFRGVGLFKANLRNADLRGANLRQSILIKTDFRGADLTGAHVYGASVWDVKLSGAVQRDLVVTEPRQAIITCDDLEVAQFIHLLISNEKLRKVIEAITGKLVLILGRFRPPRKKILDGIREELRLRNYLPVVFDFDGPASRDTTDTVKLLAQLACAVIADVTTPASVPHELATVVPMIQQPVFPIISHRSRPYAMLRDLNRYPWMQPLRKYRSRDHVFRTIVPQIVADIARIAPPLRPTLIP